ATADRHDPPPGPAAGVPYGQPAPAQPPGIDGARRDRAEPARLGRQQGQGGGVARHVPRHDLPQNPRIRHRVAELAGFAPPAAAATERGSASDRVAERLQAGFEARSRASGASANYTADKASQNWTRAAVLASDW